MATHLTDGQRATYEEQGYLFPLQACTRSEAQAYRDALEVVETKAEKTALKANCNFLIPEIDALTRLPAILDPVESLIGPDILIWGCSLFAKNAGTESYVSWHQDLNYWGLESDAQVTAWVALTPATVESGCMRFVPGSHRQIVEHRDTFADENMLTRGQELTVDVDEADAVNIELSTGEFSLHHGRTFHASHPNRSTDRRIGVAIRYIPTKSRQEGGIRTLATLVRGQDCYNHFELFDPPTTALSVEGIAAQRRASERSNSILYRGAESHARTA